MSDCGTVWGSHGCDLEPGHLLPHICKATEGDVYDCSYFDGDVVTSIDQDTGGLCEPFHLQETK